MSVARTTTAPGTGASMPDINLLDLDRFTKSYPHDWFTWLRRNAPVYRHPEPDGPGFWVVSRYVDIQAVSRNPAIFSSDDAHGGPTGLTRLERERMQKAAKGAKSLPHMDPPEHPKYRRVVDPYFRGPAVAALEAKVRAVVGDVIDEAIALKTCDFVHDVAAKVPTAIIAEVLGLPAEDRHALFDAAGVNFGASDPAMVRDEAHYMATRQWMADYSAKLAEERRQRPTDDLMTVISEARIDGEHMSRHHLALMFELLTAAGHTTTLTTIAQGMHALIERPDQWQLLRDDPSRAIVAVEELLRWVTPITYFRRAALRDTEIAGVPIAAGDSVSIWYISANRDEAVFDDPFRLDVTRPKNLHFTFGAGGPHHCLGAKLARLELRIFFEEFARRVARVDLAGEPIRVRANHFNALRRMPVTVLAA